MITATFFCTILAVTDADTFKVRCPIWPGIIIEESIRVRGVDAPESTARADCPQETELGQKAKEFAHMLKEISVTNISPDKYNRFVADVYVNNKKWADILIKNGFGVAYDGGTKSKPWCKN